MPPFYPESESLVIGRIIRMLNRGAIAEAISELRELQERAAKGHHRNPPMRRGRRIVEHSNYSAQRVGLMSQEVHAVLYRHIEDGKQYRHDFEHETSLIALLHGEANDVLITSPDGFPIWQEF